MIQGNRAEPTTDAEAIQKYRMFTEHQKGLFGEAVVGTVLKTSDIPWIPLKDIETGNAPAIESRTGRTVLPDFDAAIGKMVLFIECKCKFAPVLFRKCNQWRHGIDYHNYTCYVRASELFRKRCGLAVVELFQDESGSKWSGRLLAQRLDQLGTPIAGTSNQEHMCYWPCKSFCDIDSFGPLELWKIGRGRLANSFRGDFERIFCPTKQADLF